MTTITIPDRTEAAEYYFTYIDQVPSGDIRTILERQRSETLHLLREIPEERSLYRYAPDKWSIREWSAISTTPNGCSSSARYGSHADSILRSRASKPRQ